MNDWISELRWSVMRLAIAIMKYEQRPVDPVDELLYAHGRLRDAFRRIHPRNAYVYVDMTPWGWSRRKPAGRFSRRYS